MPHTKGTAHHSAKLTPAKVRQIRKSYEVRDRNGVRKWSYAALSRKYGVTSQSIRDVITRKSWAHVA